jgi:rhamnosyltransferase
MTNNRVCGVIVAFFPQENVLRNVAAIRPQLEALVIVDNGSSVDALKPLRAACEEMDFVLIENGENRGIAAALNIGVRWALSRGYQWMALFDQDSSSTDGMINAMIRRYESSPNPGKVAMVMPKHIEASSGIWIRPVFTEDESPFIAITSGSLIPMGTFQHCGEFEEDLFIDCVDDEYCLRARSLGYTIACITQWVLQSCDVHSGFAQFGRSITGQSADIISRATTSSCFADTGSNTRVGVSRNL